MKNTPFFSICIAAYNNDKYIIRTLDSIGIQLFRDYEVVIVNDGSTDNTLDVLKEYNDKNKNYKVINFEQNRGTIISRIECLNNSCGKYVYFIDSDDYFSDNNSLQLLYDHIHRNKYPDIVITNCYIRNHCRPDIDFIPQTGLFESYIRHNFTAIYANAYSIDVIDKVLKLISPIECRYEEDQYFNYIAYSVTRSHSVLKDKIVIIDNNVSNTYYPKDISNYDGMIERFRSLSVSHREILKYCDTYFPQYRDITVNMLKMAFDCLQQKYRLNVRTNKKI